jgi:acetyl esterase/lipase
MDVLCVVRTVLTAAMFCCSTVLAAGPPSMPDFEVADQLVPRDPLPERVIRWGDGSTVMTDVVYSTIPGYRPLHLDLYRASVDETRRPLVVFVHGGGWWAGNQRAASAFLDFPAVLATLAQRGYVVASIEYRLSGEASFPAQLLDLQEAVRFLRANAARFGIDPAKVALWGMSAGAQLAALDAVKCGMASVSASGETPSGASDCVQGFVGWFGPYDLDTHLRDTKNDTSVRGLLDCGADDCPASALAEASPVGFVDDKDPPVLLIHGADDSQVLPAQSEAFAERLRTAGVPVDLLLIADVGHGFIGATPASTRDASRRALSATFDFFARLFAVSEAHPNLNGPNGGSSNRTPAGLHQGR